ncbi:MULTISPECIES: riboflavin kinase [unclassified Rathayibacter]|uniref:riboflavin kinase n=1 Tax=unclassified Rathayibacter TaxID=2609250 RepID=UPI0009ECB99C|nr:MULTISPECIES: riboflavin kinase [unclassified Rathayibacter]
MSTQNQPTVISGVVVPGDQRGRLLGFPTANLPLPDGGVSDGVYAGTVIDAADGSEHLAAVSVGRRTSFYGRDGVRLLEAHLLDFAGDLYGHSLRVELHVKLRPQRRYRGAEALVEQLVRDVAATRTWALESASLESASAPEHRGRRHPVGARRPRDEAAAGRRTAERLAALAGSLDAADATHETVAERSRLPLGYLRWAYPSTQELLTAVRSTTAPEQP